LAYDDDYLYFAVECQKAPGTNYAPPTGRRSRDPDLTAHDRVSLLIDIDRDYATYYRLSIDQRGWTGEACLDDITWNPTWYVAAHQQADRWTVEAAIAWRELAGQAPDARQVWALGIQRVVPGVGLQSWNRPAGLDVVPEGFGYLTFE
jgi:hypothetical protein